MSTKEAKDTKVSNPHNILLSRDLDGSKVMVGETSKNKYNASQAFITYNNGTDVPTKLTWQTPIMKTPFGVKGFSIAEGEDPKYTLDLQFNATTENLKGLHKTAHKGITSIESKIVDVAVERSNEWFKKKKTRDVILEEKFKSLLRVNLLDDSGKPKTDYPDRLSFKIFVDDNGVPAVEVYDHLKNRIPIENVQQLMDTIKAGRRMKAIVQASNVWISSTGCGVSWKVVMLKLYPTEDLPDYAFESDDDNIVELDD